MSSSIVSTATTLAYGIKRKRKKWQRRRLILNYILHLWQKARPLHHSPLSHLRLLEDLGCQLIPCHLKFSESSFFCTFLQHDDNHIHRFLSVSMGNVVQVNSWVATSGKNGMWGDWIVHDCKTGDILTRASSV
ncbi:oleoyl-acyl carrier protein thioesterase 2, chloroplastic-like isoform X2 [Camellia sinensis]|uniref:oleoyl-acyl carrier protein thioesterase 2, chloroplastic-like isoform X2 n=1 Tax=Camellia sinensis TaxID=4442 RepID=UPI001036F0C5|nr:oleoyl-acyl carrier protein thioesterase 2, chloroplastic-like isoform X2 [Camellia sinensis]